jgi:predicted P-loop ATPase
LQELSSYTTADISQILERAANGSYAKTVDNFLAIMRSDPHYSNVFYNVLANHAEVHHKDRIERWDDAHEAASRSYCEKQYGLYDRGKHDDALRMLFKAREYNPVINLVDSVVWDGENRCEHFLHRWGQVDDSPYTREVSRLIFAGGIWRLYNPGCKFDDVPIFIGTRQGEGKSSLIRFLALNDAYYGECNQFDGQQAIEQLAGKWIIEIGELLALTKHKDVEASKAYLTRAVDQYRKPYDRNVCELPRRCIFIATCNDSSPLRDKTGNRRWYPVTVHCNGYELYKHERECREYIEQCWAEARERYKRGDMQNFAKQELVDEYRAAQEDAMQDDWRVGAIESYLATKSGGDYVCIRELSNKALAKDGIGHDPSLIESKDIGLIMQKFSDWEKSGRHYFSEYGQQRSWRKTQDTDNQEELPF